MSLDFLVHPNGPLRGEVEISGAKNSVLKLMAATLLAPGHYSLTNVPDIVDVRLMAELLRSMGSTVVEGKAALAIDTPEDTIPEAPYELVAKMRASIVVMGPLVARMGSARICLPGGDDFGQRPIDLHIQGLQDLGVEFLQTESYLEVKTSELIGGTVELRFPSVGATENILMAAVLARGTTVIENAAREPEICDLADFLVDMGAKVRGAGTSSIEVEGVGQLHGADHEVVADRIEAATYLAALSVARGELHLQGANAQHMDMLLAKLSEMGMKITPTDDGIKAATSGRLRSVDFSTLPYPGVATDYKPLLVAALTVAEGTGMVTENLFGDGRFKYVAELERMGANVHTNEHHAIVRGVEQLKGARVCAHDIRAGAALVVAALRAEGDTYVEHGEHIDRGYTDFAAKLNALGADVSRV
ncbi:MAG: UDP-N-acetylglucosamine 1-carboxyvinyltransferase [Acidimicrobiales bacterium]